jgi:hypothetical protein
MQREADLPHTTSTCRAACRLTSRLNGGQQETDQRGNDRNHHQQFDERERSRTATPYSLLARARSDGRHARGSSGSESNRERVPARHELNSAHFFMTHDNTPTAPVAGIGFFERYVESL